MNQLARAVLEDDLRASGRTLTHIKCLNPLWRISLNIRYIRQSAVTGRGCPAVANRGTKGRRLRATLESELAPLSNRDLLLWSAFLSVLPIRTDTRGSRP